MSQANFQVFNLSTIPQIWDDFDPDFNLPLIVGLSTGLGVLFLGLLILTIYFSIFNTGNSIFLGSNFNIPGEFDDEESRLHEEAENLPKLNQDDRENYLLAEEFQHENPPQANAIGSTLNESERDYILDRGIQAYSFQQEHARDITSSSVVIQDKLDLIFQSSVPNSVILNHPLPIHENETVYFEVKLFEFPENSHASIGLAAKPYPGFRLPGYNKYSIAYESNGTVRINQPFYSPQAWDKLIEGDVLGVGFKPRSGTIFFTHNGKKLVEAVHNVKFDLFPIVGVRGAGKLNVNLGQLGFVFIEANVKKWGFGSVYGTIGIPPAYGKETINDTVLDKGEELPPNYPSEEETFFGPSALLSNPQNNINYGSTSTSIKPEPIAQLAPYDSSSNRPNKVISSPPSYNGELDEPKIEVQHNTPEVSSGVDNIRERLYERRSSAFDQQNNQYDSLAITQAQPKPSDEQEQEEAQNNQEVQEQEPIKVAAESEVQEQPSKESTPQPTSSDTQDGDEDDDGDDEDSKEHTPEPTQPPAQGTPSSSNSRSAGKGKKNLKKKKKGKKKGKKNW